MTTTSILLCSVLLGAAPEVEAQPVVGSAVRGTIAALGPATITLTTPQGPVTLETAKLLGLSVKQPEPAGKAQPTVWLELVDGSALVGAGYAAGEGVAKLALLGGATLEVPLRDVKWVQLQPHAETLARQWPRIVEGPLQADVLVTRKGDSLDDHKGVLRSVTDRTVQFELDGDVLPVKREKVFGLAYHQAAGRELPEPTCTVYEASGSVWSARSVALAGGELVWTTPTGLKVARPLSALTRLDLSRGKLVYLSDLKPESFEWVPYFGMGREMPSRSEFYAPRGDRSLLSGPLQVDGIRYAKGLALHSRTTLVYRLPGRFRRLVAVAGIDDRVRPRGNVRLVIRGDDRVLLDTAVAGTDPARPLDLDVADVRRLTILVDFGEDLDVADHLDLCEARLLQ
jgi:hypothetical protein